MNGNASIDGDVNVSGILDAGVVDAELLYVSGYMGSSQIDGSWNRIRGDSLELNHIDTYISGDVHMSEDLNVSEDLYVSDGLYVSGPVDFSYSSEVRVPTPDQDDEAANKSYVDSAISTEASSRDTAISDAIAGDNARGLVQLAVTENVANLSEYYLSYEGPDGLTNPAQGDLILLTAQTTTSENGIYEVSSVTSTYDSNQGGSGPTASDYYVSLARASGFDSSEEFITGSFVFVEKGSQVGQGYVLGELASDFALGTSPVNYLQFTVDTTKDVTFDQSVSSSSLASSGDLTVSGNSSLSNVTVSGNTSMNGNASIDGDVNVSGILDAGVVDAELLYVSGYMGSSQIDGSWNRIRGDSLELNHIDTYISGDVHMSEDLNVSEDLYVSDGLYVSGPVDFSYSSEVRVPTPDQDDEAANKSYVDSAISTEASSRDTAISDAIAGDNARGLVQLAVTENVANLSEYYLSYEGPDGLTNPAQGDLILLTAQTTTSENGIYEVSSVTSTYDSNQGGSGPTASDYYVSLARASGFDSSEEFITGSFVFVEKGSQVGQGYVLGELASDFALGTSPVNYLQFTVDTTKDVTFDQSVSSSSLASSGDLTVSGNSSLSNVTVSGNTSMNGNASIDGDVNVSGVLDADIVDTNMLYVQGGPAGSSRIDGIINRIRGDILELNHMDTNITGSVAISGNTSMNGNASIDGDVNVFGVLDADIVDTNMLYVQGGPASSRIDGMINRIRGDILELNHMDTNITGNVVISDALYVSGPVDFSYSSEVRVPTPDQDDEAANKSYVDNLVSTSIAGDNARGLVQLAVTENVANLSEYYLSYEGPDGLTNPAQGDLILLTAQTTTSENGIYEVSSVTSTYDSNQGGSGPTASDYYVSLARASGFDSSEEFITGSFVFVEKGSQVGQGYVLGELASDFALGTSPVNYLQFTVDTTKDVTFDQSVSSSSLASSGDLTVSGNSSLSNVTVSGNTSMNGNASIDGDVNVSGVLDADIVDTNMLYVQGGPAGSSRIDGIINRIRGDILELNHMDTNITGNVVISDALYVSGPVDFSYSSEVRVPTPDQDDEAANKSYVDSAISTEASSRDTAISDAIAGDNARGLVQLAVTENVANLSEYYLSYEGPDGLTNPAQGDLILLIGQTTTSENGIYEVSSVTSTYDSNQGGSGPTASDYYVSLARASGFDSSEEFITGSFVFVEKGSQVGQGYVLGELASDFALGTSPVNYLQFTVDTTKDVTFDQSVSSSSLASSGDLTVSGNSSLSNVTVTGDTTMNGNASIDGDVNVFGILDADIVDTNMLYVQGGPAGYSRIDGIINRIRGDILELNHVDTNITGSVVISGNTSMNGNVTIANDLIVSGEITASSDERLKKNIKTIPNALEKVQQLRGVEFEFADSGKDSVGLIAQEVENVIPQVVLTTEQNNLPDMKSVNYASLVGVLVEAIKEQQLQIDDLKAQVSLLEAANNMNE